MGKRRFQSGEKTAIGIFAVCCALLVICTVGIFIAMLLTEARFDEGTTINDIDCSKLTVEETIERIESVSSNITIRMVVIKNEKEVDVKEYILNEEEVQSFEIKVEEAAIRRFLETQEQVGTKKFKIQVGVNEENVLRFLRSIPEYKNGEVRSPEDAYLQIGKSGTLEIVKEVQGNEIDLESAAKCIVEAIEESQNEIDLSQITKILPTRISKDLGENQEAINKYLKTALHFKLNDGGIVTLDFSTMKDWLIQKEDGTYEIDLESNLPLFVDELSKRVSSANHKVTFKPTDKDEITLEVGDGIPSKLDKEAEIEEIQKYIQTEKSINLIPIYDRALVTLETDTYIELDIARQKVWFYKEGECILETDCVTGNVASGQSTPTGVYYLTYKSKDAVLRGYNNDGSKYASPVDFWMPFNGGIGFHDASWRYGKFGGNIYLNDGSHGCVNLPRSAAETMYDNIDSSIPIIVYNSSN